MRPKRCNINPTSINNSYKNTLSRTLKKVTFPGNKMSVMWDWITEKLTGNFKTSQNIVSVLMNQHPLRLRLIISLYYKYLFVVNSINIQRMSFSKVCLMTYCFLGMGQKPETTVLISSISNSFVHSLLLCPLRQL